MSGTIEQQELVDQLRELGVPPASVLLVHSSFSAIGPVADGPRGLITALVSAIGADGTLVMPSMSYEDDLPFDPSASDCEDMGVVADTFWRLPGVLRSDSPHAFAAKGPRASEITRPHPVDIPHGIDSPVGRVYDLDGLVLLLGVGHEANTTVHLAESMAGVRYRRPKHVTVMRSAVAMRVDYSEIDHCGQRFSLVGEWLDAEGLQRRGTVGHAQAALACSRDIVRVVTMRLAADEMTFLHPFGVDEECDEARASLTDSLSRSAPSL